MTVLVHEMVLNTNMSCPFRCGKGKIEYNPERINKLSDSQLENSLKAEAIRIILKHPYERQPDGCKRKSMALGSNLVLSDNYDFTEINLPKPSDFGLPEKESYEWYSMRIERKGLLLVSYRRCVIIESQFAGFRGRPALSPAQADQEE